MHLKNLFILFLFLSVVYSTAPSWVAQGVSLNYSMGTTSIYFTVTGNSNNQIHLSEKVVADTVSNLNPIENASKDFGNFWFDPAQLSSIFYGQTVDGYTYSAESQTTFAGKTYDAITIQATIQGVTTNKIYDKTTGLLLEWDVTGQPTVYLAAQYIPAFAPATPPPQNNQPPQNTPPPPPPQNNSGNAPPPPPQQNTPPPQNNSQNKTTKPKLIPIPPPAPSPPPSSSLPCCPSGFVLLILTFVMFKYKN